MQESVAVSVSHEAGRPLLIRVEGEVDLSNASLLEEKITEADRGEKNVLLDLEGLEFIDSTGLTVIVRLGKRIKERGGELSIAIVKPSIRKLFAITALDKQFGIFDSLGDASASFH